MEEFLWKSNLGYESESLVAPHIRSQTIPVLVDNVKQLDEFKMTRCTFFTINPIASLDDWVSLLRLKVVPFLLFGITAVLYRPDRRSKRFLSSETIDHLFRQIEEVDGLVVESEHIWLPNYLFKLNNHILSPKQEQPYLQRGAVWRVGSTLFKLALIFQRELINTFDFSDRCQDLEERRQALLNYSQEESEAFRTWSIEQITAAMGNYARQREDPARGVLEWIDDEGNRRLG